MLAVNKVCLELFVVVVVFGAATPQGDYYSQACYCPVVRGEGQTRELSDGFYTVDCDDTFFGECVW